MTATKPLRLSGRTALVTGAAGGIGRACAEALGAEGATVIVADIDSAGATETCTRVAAAGGHAVSQRLNVAEEADWAALSEFVERAFGKLEILVNNAGICISSPLQAMTFASWRRQMAINLDSLFLATKSMLPLMIAAGGGSIVNLSSVAGLKGVPGMTGYCATKAGVRLFTKALALECAQAGNNVRVNSLHPGAIETPIWLKLGNDGELPDPAARRNDDTMAEIRALSAQATPLGHAGTPQDIAAGVIFLASDAARFITGTELVIDGGAMAG